MISLRFLFQKKKIMKSTACKFFLYIIIVSHASKLSFFFFRNGENAPYAFRHEMDLTRNVTKFEEAVKDLTLIANVDSPESGLDAIAQALLCDEGESNIIGWRTDKQVQKVIIVITDQEMHYAGLLTYL